ncbi:hypothetical protein jhhlp_005862 [Lomentospora prolificans]|uniref:Uncharacterized protein n=1 Tax=Lomentospora prolificans TaxID=41688 RepID=A0A2N3N498_9PEZI|nr:hypothetical protein jhhlp_005862 [Lomentospora prolificans]
MRIGQEPAVVVRENTTDLRFRKEMTKAAVEIREIDLTIQTREVEIPAGDVGKLMQGRRRRLLLWKELRSCAARGSAVEDGCVANGSRRACGSVMECVKSWTYLHNESVNIWSHLIGAVIFFYLPYYMFTVAIPPRYAIATTEDIVVCSAWFLGVAICFVLSVCFHTLMAHSETLYQKTLQLDFQGVLILMTGSTLSMTTYTTCLSPAHRLAHHLVNLTLGLSASLATTSPALGEVHLGRYRAVLFALFGGGVFVLPIWWAWREDAVGLGVPFTLGTAFFNALGMGAYMIRVSSGGVRPPKSRRIAVLALAVLPARETKANRDAFGAEDDAVSGKVVAREV